MSCWKMVKMIIRGEMRTNFWATFFSPELVFWKRRFKKVNFCEKKNANMGNALHARWLIKEKEIIQWNHHLHQWILFFFPPTCKKVLRVLIVPLSLLLGERVWVLFCVVRSCSVFLWSVLFAYRQCCLGFFCFFLTNKKGIESSMVKNTTNIAYLRIPYHT